MEVSDTEVLDTEVSDTDVSEGYEGCQEARGRVGFARGFNVLLYDILQEVFCQAFGILF